MQFNKFYFKTFALLFTLTQLLIACEFSEEQLSDDYPLIMQGTYEMQVKTDTATIPFEFQLVTAIDSAVYGVIKSERIDYQAPMALDSITDDSLYFHYYTSQLALSKNTAKMKGVLDTWRGQHHSVMVQQTSDSASEALLDSRKMLPIKLDREVTSFAWAAPISSEKLYFVSENQIYLATRKGVHWKTKSVNYDTALWKFYSISLNSDQAKMIAHGAPKKNGLAHLGGGDYYELTLSSPTKINAIKHLSFISTESYDIFPSYTATDAILISTGGEYEKVKNKGRTDIFLAEPTETDSFNIKKLDENFNSELPEAGAFMDKEERFILFYRKNFAKKLRDRIHISYRQENGWSEPKVLGPPVNRGFNWTYGPRTDPEGKFLFFNSGFRGRSEIFRIPTNQIPELKKY